MGIKEEDLVRLLDEYMGQNGSYMKPKVDENGEVSFWIAKDNGRSLDGNVNFELAEDMDDEKEETETQLFTGNPNVECAFCADIPNITDIASDDE